MEDAEYTADPPTLIREAYGRTLIGDTFTQTDGSNRRATPKDIELLYAWLRWMEESVPSETRDWAAREPPVIVSEIASAFWPELSRGNSSPQKA